MIVSTKQLTHGFTLLELLVAVAIFSVLSAMAYGGLRNVIDNSQQTDLSMQRLQEVQLAVLKISRDFSQMSQRSIRDEYGNRQDYLISGLGGDIIIEFSRNGRRNPAELQRSHLQRVAYRLEENQLYRLDWQHLDRPQEMQPYESVLLTEVESISIRFLDTNNEWHEQWPPLNTSVQAGDMSEFPSAVELALELTDWGEIMRIYRISS